MENKPPELLKAPKHVVYLYDTPLEEFCQI